MHLEPGHVEPRRRGDAVGRAIGLPRPSPTPTEEAPTFPTEAFADISEKPVSEETATEFQAALEDMVGDGGMSATMMTADGTWSGAAGKADGVRDVWIDSQFGIASITKSLIAAQVMQMVEAGELSLDDPASDHFPADLDFDTNGATIRQLLSMRAGIPDWYGDAMQLEMARDRRRRWSTDEVLALVDAGRTPPGEAELYTDTNYTLLGLVIEHVRDRPLVDVLRDGVLDVEGTERLIYQPDEAPTDPMAMPSGEPRSAFEEGAGYLPSLSDASSAGPAGAMASDAISLAHWWRAFCAGEIVSEASLTEMSTFYDGPDGYGLGLFNPTVDLHVEAIGHVGGNFGYVSWAACLPEEGSVVVVLTNHDVEDKSGIAEPLVEALTSS
jgi:D-alanyl-D-alanine carboxypeptidase